MQKPPDLIEIKHTRLSDVLRWGRKACVLGELKSRSYPVPDGVCLSTKAFFQAGVDLEIDQSLDSALRLAAERLLHSNQALAVRSSAVREDLPGASYAGIYESVIGVSRPGGVIAAVRKVWKSSTHAARLPPQQASNSEGTMNGMGVVIQPVIHAEVAGVCYSIDPVQPGSGNLVINATWGLGAGVVEGAIPSDTYWLRREDLKVVNQHIVEKDTCYALDPESGLARTSVSPSRQHMACLPEEWAVRIGQFAMAVEGLFGEPQDVEWAIADDQVWILQSRPIASLNRDDPRIFPIKWERPEDSQRRWTRRRYELLRNAPLLPLDIAYVRLQESTRAETCQLIGADRNEDIRVINGQIYSSPAPFPLSQAELHIRKQAFQDLTQRLVQEARTAWDHWGPEIEQANERLSAVDTRHLDGPGLANFLEMAMAARSRHSMLHPLIWIKPPQAYFEAFQAVSGLSGTEAQAAASRLLEGVESPLTRLIDGLYHLAQEARSTPTVSGWVRDRANDPSNQKLEALDDFPGSTPGAAAWLTKFNAFLSEFGDRNGGGYGSEAFLSTPTWRDQPIQVIRLVAQFLEEEVEPPRQQRERSRRKIDAQVEALCAQCQDAQATDEFVRQLQYARRVQAVVEIHNHQIEQIGLGQLRRAVLAASGWLQSRGVLSAGEDIFWLDFPEILDLLRGQENAQPEDRIQERQEDYQEWSQYGPPPHLGLPDASLPPRQVYGYAKELDTGISQKAGEIRGIGASAGQASGRARVLEPWQTAPPVIPGDILVAENAGPLWIPFFPLLRGIVLEVGSIGQHAATTAREYGIPAVIGVRNATQVIKDGDWITIDGTQGIVRVGGQVANPG